MSAAVDARGLKRVCVGCGIRFYDLNKRPIVCPNCNNEFKGEVKAKGRRGARLAEDEAPEKEKEAQAANDDRYEEIEATADTVSLEEVEEGGDDTDEEDLGIEEGGIEDLEDEDLEVEVDKKE